MFLSSNRSILLAIAILLGAYSQVRAQSDTKEVAINFEGWVGDKEFVCGKSYEGVGVSESTITPSDFRFYVSDVALIDGDGNAVPLELEQDGKWQYQNTALLDFEDGTNSCDNGTTEVNTTVVGTIPQGDYQSLQFTMGVPENLNHEDAAIAPSPLNLTSMWWNWQGGYKFLRVELETEQAISSVPVSNSDRATGSQDEDSVEIKQTTTQTSAQPSILKDGESTQAQANSNAYLIHLGSTGCSDSAQSNLFECSNPNRVNVMLEDFNPEDSVVVADLAGLLAESDLSTNEANTAMGCMSSPEDSDCLPIMQSLSLGSQNTEQKFFGVK